LERRTIIPVPVGDQLSARNQAVRPPFPGETERTQYQPGVTVQQVFAEISRVPKSARFSRLWLATPFGEHFLRLPEVDALDESGTEQT
jgi:hypothetical protein